MRLEDLDRRQEREHGRDLRRRHAGGETGDVAARHGRIDDHPRELDCVEGHGFLGDSHVDAVEGDELVQQVELGLRLAVELDDATVLDHEGGLWVEGAREGDQAERRVLGNEVVAADRPVGVEVRAG